MTMPSCFLEVQCLVFDLMGTCTDWRNSITSAMKTYPLPPQLSSDTELTSLAAEWRAGFFKFILDSFTAGEESPDIDKVHSLILDQLLSRRGINRETWDDKIRTELVNAWHYQQAWPDSVQGLESLKKRLFIVVLANGTTRLQLDIIKSSSLPFHTLFSSQLLGATKPHPDIYHKALDLINLKASEVAMVAAHAYDLRAAKKVGMKTIYIKRSTEDPDENMKQLREEFDLFLDGTDEKGGLLKLAALWDEN